MAMDPNNLSDDQKRQVVGKANFCCLSIYSCIAFICGIYATAYCAFVQRNVETGSGFQSYCTSEGIDQGLCNTLTENHGVGFWTWQTTVPQNQVVCLGYTQWIPGLGYVTPEFDLNFNSARAFTYVANIFGGIGFFTIWLASCCPMSQARLKGLSCNFFIATLFQGLTLIIFQSNVCQTGFFSAYFTPAGSDPTTPPTDVIVSTTCSLSTGSNLAITATVFYFLCMLTVPAATVPIPLGMPGGLGGGTAAEEAEGAPAQEA